MPLNLYCIWLLHVLSNLATNQTLHIHIYVLDTRKITLHPTQPTIPLRWLTSFADFLFQIAFQHKVHTPGLMGCMWQWEPLMAPVWRNSGKQTPGEWAGGKTIRARQKWTTMIAEGCCEISFDLSGERLKKITCWQFCSGSVKRLNSCRGHWFHPTPKKYKNDPDTNRWSWSDLHMYMHTLCISPA